MKETVKKKAAKNNNTIFGEYIATKMDSYSDRCKNIVQHLINNIIFDADMGKFDYDQNISPYPQPVNSSAYGSIPSHSLQSCNQSLQTSTTSTPLPSPASDQVSYNSENYLSPVQYSQTIEQPSGELSTFITNFQP